MAASIRELLQEASTRLQMRSASPAVDAHYLLMHVLKKERTWLRLHEEVRVSAAQHENFDALLARRERGEPVAYLTGSRGFWTLDLAVNRHTLIPRPETEMLVEFALEKIPAGKARHVLDLGTGSGAIALAIKKERPECVVSAVDASRDALAVAAGNAERLQLPVTFLHSDWFSALPGRRFDLLLANPPYIDADDAHLGQGDVRFEPLSALVSAAHGLQDITRIAADAPQHAGAGAWLAFEHGHDQGAAVRSILLQNGFSGIESRRDLGGHERITFGCLLAAAGSESHAG
ncbi:MAG: peptide chain release factor N(5)-glutamine methyltransferase [bacterium]|nr:peptide chain release factor N(5)-glutamine methyltransferase [bacterium]